MTDADALKIELADLSFLDEGEYEAQIYADGANADFEANPYAMNISREQVSKDSALSLTLARSGGVAIRFRKL